MDTDICAYCGENKWQNKEKHIVEIAKFLQEKIREIQQIFKKESEKYERKRND